MFFYFRVKGHGEERNHVKFVKIELDLSAPSLIVFVIGAIMMILAGTGFGETNPTSPGSSASLDVLHKYVAQEPPNSGSTTTRYTQYESITTRNGLLSMEVPVRWKEIEEAPWTEQRARVGSSLTASRDMEQFKSTWEEPGVAFAVSVDFASKHTPQTLLDTLPMSTEYDYAQACTYLDREPYHDSRYQGHFDIWNECADTSTIVVTLAAAPADHSFLAFLFIQLTSDAELTVLDHILASFVVSEQNLPEPNSGWEASTDQGNDAKYTGYQEIYTSNGFLSMEIPIEWSDAREATWSEGALEGEALLASPDLDKFWDSWLVPGVAFGASYDMTHGHTPLSLLDARPFNDEFFYAESCTYLERTSYDDEWYSGAYDMWGSCGGHNRVAMSMVVAPQNGEYLVAIYMTMSTQREIDAMVQVLETFMVNA